MAVFDFYNVLTDPENHHRLHKGKIEYTCQAGKGTLYYFSDGDDHPSPAGSRKATEEFVPLLNAYYSQWAQRRPKTAPASQPPLDKAAHVAAAETPMAVATPPQAEPAAVTTAERLIDDFEREPRAWAAFLDAGKDTRLTFATDKETKHNGVASLHILYDLAPESWAACSLVYDRPQDWSRSHGLCLYVHAEKLGQPITIVAYGGKSANDLLHFECRLKAGQAAIDGWQRIDIPWSRLRAPEWQGDGTQKYDPRSAMGVAVTFQSSAGGRRAGKLWIDDVGLSATQSDGKSPSRTAPR